MSSGPARRAVTTVRVRALDGDQVRDVPDKLVTEEPMEIRVHGPGQEPEALAVTMRTPGHDFELAVGFCLTEGLLHSADDLDSVAYCLAGEGEQEYNVVTVKLRAPGRPARPRPAPSSPTRAAGCAARPRSTRSSSSARRWPTGRCSRGRCSPRLPERLREAQRVFDATGGLHAAARFTADGELVALREDVGRHNALDKVIGHALLERAAPALRRRCSWCRGG